MNIKNFISKWSDNYFSIKEKSSRRDRITSVLIFAIVLFVFALNISDLIKNYKTNGFEISKDLYFGSNLCKALIYQFTILFGLLIRLISLKFNNKNSFRFAEIGVLISFASWLGYLVWSAMRRSEISQIAAVNWSSHLHSLNGDAALLISIGFALWFVYKIIFLIAVTWKTIRK